MDMGADVYMSRSRSSWPTPWDENPAAPASPPDTPEAASTWTRRSLIVSIEPWSAPRRSVRFDTDRRTCRSKGGAGQRAG